MDVCVEVFKIKRRWLETIRAHGRMPFAMQRPRDPHTGNRGAVAVDLDGLVYTIGVVGVNEMVQHHTGLQMHESREAFSLAVLAMTKMELYAKELSERHKMTIALARTPAETTAQRFAVADCSTASSGITRRRSLRVISRGRSTTLTRRAISRSITRTGRMSHPARRSRYPRGSRSNMSSSRSSTAGTSSTSGSVSPDPIPGG